MFDDFVKKFGKPVLHIVWLAGGIDDLSDLKNDVWYLEKP
jgi:hypothetical protein